MTAEKEEKSLSLSDFLGMETERLDRVRNDQMESKGYKEFWKPGKGVHDVSLLARIPRSTSGKFGPRMAFRIYEKAEKTEFDWSINPLSPLYRELINALKGSKGKSVELKVMKSGEGLSTRWELV